MDKIFAKMFGIPEIKKNGIIINFPFKKAEALFYYLLIKRKTTRDELVGLLWSDIGESAARGNLRNSLYVIRKAFGMDIIKPDQSQIITIDENVDIVTDIDIFINEKNNIGIYTGELLKDFFIKDCEEYEQWLLNQREYYNRVYTDRLYKKLENSLDKDKSSAEQYCKLLIEIDKFEERPYRVLMEIYANNRQYNKAICLYQKLKEILEEDLCVTPSAKTKDIYNQILRFKKLEEDNISASQKGFFYGREKEIDYLLQNFESFIEGELYHSILVTGEAGIGKTRLIDRFLSLIDLSQVYLFQVDCYYDERDCILKPWNMIIKNIFSIIEMEKNNILIPQLWKNNIVHAFPFLGSESDYLEINSIEKINDINYQVLEEALSNIINTLSDNKKMIIVFDDMQWIDRISLNLLRRILLNDLDKNILFLGASREEYNYELDKFLTLLNRYDKIEKIEINRFTKDETFNFLDLALPDYKLSKEQKERIFEETEGNTCFMVEVSNGIKENIYCDFIPSKVEDIIKTRFLNITGRNREVLNIISLFFDGIKMELLKDLTDIDEFELINTIEELEKKNIIEEKLIDNDIVFRFTHQMLRKYIYDSLSMIRRKTLHERAGQVLEASLTGRQGDILVYPKIIYNYSRSENQLKTLEYTLKNANVYLEYNLDLFPKCGAIDFKEDENISYFQDGNIIPYLEKMEDLINSLEMHRYNTDEILKLKIMLNLIRGRYLIRIGQYGEGVSSINKVIEGAKEIKDHEYLLLGHRQLIYYGIQVSDIELMEREIFAALKICDEIEFNFEKAALLRFKGLNRMMRSDYTEAYRLLNESISLFEMLNQRQNIYSVNIAAAYNYIGEIHRLNKNFEEAIIYYDKAIDICKAKGVIRGIAIFYTNAGRCAIDNKDYEKGKQYIEKALYYYTNVNALSGRAIAEGLMAFIKVKEENYETALQFLIDADRHVHIQRKAFELGVFRKVQAIIKEQMKDNPKLRGTFFSYLNQNVDYYVDEAIKHFKKVNETYEIEYLKLMIK